MRADGLHADLQSQRDLRVRVALLQQRQDFSLARRQQPLHDRALPAAGSPRRQLHAARGEVNRVEHVTRLSLARQAGARAERHQLGGLGAREVPPEQHEARGGMARAEVADLGRLGERHDVEEGDVGMMRLQDDRDALVLSDDGDYLEARIGVDQLAQTGTEKVTERSEHDRRCAPRRARRCGRGNAHGICIDRSGLSGERTLPRNYPGRNAKIPRREDESKARSEQHGSMARFLALALVTALVSLPSVASARSGVTTGVGHARRDARRLRAARSLIMRDPVALATTLAERYWAAVPCEGQVTVLAEQPLPADLESPTDGWATFESSLGQNDLQAPASTYTHCTISLARSQWASRVAMASDWNMFCLTVVHEMGHLLGHPHSLAPDSVMAPEFTDESSVPAICREARTQVEASAGLARSR
jgi:hypothetical protein